MTFSSLNAGMMMDTFGALSKATGRLGRRMKDRTMMKMERKMPMLSTVQKAITSRSCVPAIAENDRLSRTAAVPSALGISCARVMPSRSASVVNS